jgi:ABC-type Fe3+ transport system permease subunit
MRQLTFKAARGLARLCFAAGAGFFPILLIYIALHRPGIDIVSALNSQLDFQALAQFFIPDSARVSAFWASAMRTIGYSTVASGFALIISMLFVLSVALRTARTAATASFFLLGLALLPQTFLVLALLKAAHLLGVSTASPGMIVLALTLSLVPFGCWISWATTAHDVGATLRNLAADGASPATAVRVLLTEIRLKLLQVYLILFAFAFGNFTIPFALGDNSTYTALVYLMSFSSNLGRDWSSIASAGVLILLPLCTIGAVAGFALSAQLRARTK